MSVLNDRPDIVYFSTKTWEHVFSAAFRQHMADSHCADIHGYGMTVKATFGAYSLDVRNWVVDFGSLKSFKGWMEDNFDHKLLVAKDDPYVTKLHLLDNRAASVHIVEATGCEAIARMCFEWLELWLQGNGYTPRCWVYSLEVMEHSGNSALVQRTTLPVRIEGNGAHPDESTVGSSSGA